MTANMASRTRRGQNKPDKKVEYIYDLPYPNRVAICKIMDVGGEWRTLAGEIGITVDDIRLFEYKHQQPGGSPSDEVLTWWGHKNAKIEELYKMLKFIQCNRALNHLRGFVPDSYFEDTSSVSKHYDSTTIVHQTSPFDGKPFQQDLPLPQMPFATSKNSSLEKPDYPRIPAKNQNFPVEGSYTNSLSNNSSSDTDSLGKVTVNEAPKTHHRRPLKSVNQSKTDGMLNSTNQAKLSEQDATLSGFHAFTYSEVQTACNNFHRDNLLGTGGFGEVFRATLKETPVAIKVMKPRGSMNCEENMLPKFLFSEIQALLRYRHDHIIPLFAYSVDGPKLCLIYQFMMQGSLEDRLACKNGTKPLSWATRLKILKGAACGLNYLHTAADRPLVHGDVKSANILLDQHFEPRIADFGLAKMATSGTSSKLTYVSRSDNAGKVYGSRAYLPEEFFRAFVYSVWTDIFSFGVVIYEVCTGDRAHDPRREGGDNLHAFVATVMATKNKDKLLQIRDSQGGSWSKEGWLHLIHLGAKCTHNKKKQRPEMKQVLDSLEKLSAETRVTMNEGSGSDPESSFTVTHQDQGKGQTLKGQGQQMDNIPGVNLQRMALERIKLSKLGEEAELASDPEKLKMLGLEDESDPGSLSQSDLGSDQNKLQQIEEFDEKNFSKTDKSESIPYLLQQQYDLKSAENSISHHEMSPDLDTPVPVPSLKEAQVNSGTTGYYVNYPQQDGSYRYQDTGPLYVNDPSWNRVLETGPAYVNITQQQFVAQQPNSANYPQEPQTTLKPPGALVTPNGSQSVAPCPIHEDCKSQVTECIQNLANLDLEASLQYSLQYGAVRNDTSQLNDASTAEIINQKQNKALPDFMQAVLDDSGEEDEKEQQSTIGGGYPTHCGQTQNQSSPPVYAVSHLK